MPDQRNANRGMERGRAPQEHPFDFLNPAGIQEAANEHPIETDAMPESALLIRKAVRRRQIQATKRKRMADIINRIPEPGETFHVVSNGTFDHFSFVPRISELMGTVDAFYGSTWTMNRENALGLLDLYDKGRLKAVAILTGLYFKRRETAIYATVLEGLQERGQRYTAFKNHAKVSLFAGFEADTYITVEGSANYTANPRLENFTVTNDRPLFEMHQTWMEEMLV